jgi:hypothetical protein
MSNDSSPRGSEVSLCDPEEGNGLSEAEILSLPNMRVLEINDQIRELQTIIRDK